MRFNKEEEKTIKKLFFAGAESREIAKVMGCSNYKVYTYLQENDLYLKRYEKVIAEREKKLRRLFNEGKSATEMAEILNLSLSTVTKALASYGLNGKDRKREEQKIILRQYLEDGLSHREIAEKMGKSCSGIEYLIKSYGYVGLSKRTS